MKLSLEEQEILVPVRLRNGRVEKITNEMLTVFTEHK